jgi:hypothetical protein
MSKFILLEDALQLIAELKATYAQWEIDQVFSECEIHAKVATLESIETRLTLMAINPEKEIRA